MPTYDYDKNNKLHWLLGSESYATKKAKEEFEKEFKKAILEEKIHCFNTGLSVSMTEEKQKEVYKLLERCADFYEVEALARYLYDDNYIPTIEEVRKRGKVLHSIVPIKDFLALRPNPKRSF